MPLSVRSGGASVAGRRESNEDAIWSDARYLLHILADGTGGRAGGQFAAELACETLAADLAPATVAQGAAAGLEGSIEHAVGRAHRIIRERQIDPKLHGMATTVVVLATSDNKLHVAHVGDSRAYLLRGRELIALTRDHSLANYLADNPTVQPKVQRPGNTLMRALGLTAETPKVDHRVVDLEPGDVVVACSDGVSAFLPEWMIAAILAGAAKRSPEDVANALIRAALAQGSMDNASAIVLSARSETEAPAERSLGWLAFLEGPRQGDVIGLDAAAEIGSDPRCAVAIADPGAADRHAVIQATELGFAVRDLGASGGTFLNDVAVREEVLVDGDVIRVGGTRMVFKCHRA